MRYKVVWEEKVGESRGGLWPAPRLGRQKVSAFTVSK